MVAAYWRLIRTINAWPWRKNLEQRRSEEHTSELQSPCNLVCRLLLEKKKHNSLLRLVLFWCFGLHIDAISRLTERYMIRSRPRMPVEMFEGHLTSVSATNRDSLHAPG